MLKQLCTQKSYVLPNKKKSKVNKSAADYIMHRFDTVIAIARDLQNE